MDRALTVKEVMNQVRAGKMAYRAFADAESLLSTLESMEQTSTEIEDRLFKLRAEEMDQNAKKAAALADIDAAKKQADDILKAANEAAEAIAEAARKASADAKDAMAAAQAEFDGKMNAQNVYLKQGQDNLQAVKTDLANAKAELANVQEAKRALLEKLQG